MKTITDFFRTLSTILAIAVISDQAQADTHMMQPVGNMVTLHAMASTSNHGSLAFNNGWMRVLPDGSEEKFNLNPKKGELLVVTDVDWSYRAQVQNGIPEKLRRNYQLSIRHVQPDGNVPLFLSNPRELAIDQWDEDWYIMGGHDSLTSGFVLSDISKLSARIWPMIRPVMDSSFPQNNSTDVTSLILHGYVITQW